MHKRIVCNLSSNPPAYKQCFGGQQSKARCLSPTEINRAECTLESYVCVQTKRVEQAGGVPGRMGMHSRAIGSNDVEPVLPTSRGLDVRKKLIGEGDKQRANRRKFFIASLLFAGLGRVYARGRQ